MKVVAKDHKGNRYNFDGRWSTQTESAEAQAVVNLLNQVVRIGRKALPGFEGWSEAVPPQRDFEDAMGVAGYMGLSVVEAVLDEVSGDDY